MITRAIVEEVLSPSQIRIRIPTVNRVAGTPLATPTKDLNVATVCTLPNCYSNFNVGDVVFVAFEDNTLHKAVILGHLCREAVYNTQPDLNVGDLTVRGSTKLPQSTEIGEVTSSELQYLSGVRDNIQRQLDHINNIIASTEFVYRDTQPDPAPENPEDSENPEDPGDTDDSGNTEPPDSSTPSNPSETPSATMPTIRLVNGRISSPKQDISEDNPFIITVEVTQGSIQEGDQLQICRRTGFLYTYGETIVRKLKLKKLTEHVITAEDVKKPFLELRVTNTSKASKSIFQSSPFKVGSANVYIPQPVYVRIRRKILDNSGNDVNGTFSNVVQFVPTRSQSYSVSMR